MEDSYTAISGSVLISRDEIVIAHAENLLSREEANIKMVRGISAEGIIASPCYICNHESPNNSAHMFSFVKHCSRSLVFLILRLQQLSWLFHCSFSTC